MSDYTDAAPNVSKLVNAAKFATDFPAPPPPPEPPAEPNAAKRMALYEAYRDEYNANGGAVNLGRLARSLDVPRRWCRKIAAEVAVARAVVHA